MKEDLEERSLKELLENLDNKEVGRVLQVIAKTFIKENIPIVEGIVVLLCAATGGLEECFKIKNKEEKAKGIILSLALFKDVLEAQLRIRDGGEES